VCCSKHVEPSINKLRNNKFYYKLHLVGISTEQNNFHFIIQPTQMWCCWIVQILLSDLQCKYHTLPSTSLAITKTSSMGISLASSPKACYMRLHPNTATIWSRQKEGGSKEHYGGGKLILWSEVCPAVTSSATSTYMICNHM